MTRRAGIKIFISILMMACTWSVAHADEVLLPQQSRSGPQPPPGVEPKVPDKVPLTDADGFIASVPGYSWRHGCGPTAVGMAVGYYDRIGYSDLIPGDASTQTNAVNQAIASQGGAQHYEDYSLPLDFWPTLELDLSEPPPGDEHASNCIADYMETSWSSAGNYYGWSWSNYIGTAWVGYVNQVAPQYLPTYQNYSSGQLTWGVLTSEIDSFRPMIFLVDTDGDGSTDHFVTVVGYRDTYGIQEYGCLDTWAPPDVVRWCEFRGMAPGAAWGVWGGTGLRLLGGSPIPATTPTGLVLLVLAMGVALRRRLRG